MPMNRHAIELGVFVGLVNTVIFMHNMPPVTDVRAADPYNPQVESAERTALLETTALTLLVAGFARSMETFIIGGAVIIAVDFTFKHANAVNPSTNKMAPDAVSAGGSLHPLPDYSVAQADQNAG
jgi:hypothetical protein